MPPEAATITDVPIRLRTMLIDVNKMSMSFVGQIGAREIINYKNNSLNCGIRGFINNYWSENSRM